MDIKQLNLNYATPGSISEKIENYVLNMNGRSIRTAYYNLKYGIVNLFRWFKVIWNDRDWDFAYNYAIMQCKFKSMLKYFERSNITVDNDVVVKQIKFCLKILDRLNNDDAYTHPLYKKHLKEEDFIYNNKIPHEEYIKYFEWEEFQRNRDIRLLFKVIEKYSDTWWD